MSFFTAIYAGRGWMGNYQLLDVRCAGQRRDHCWLDKYHNEIPADIEEGMLIQGDGLVRPYEDRWTLTGVCQVSEVA